MKNRMKKMMVALLAGVMVCGMCIGVSAAAHEHAYSYMGNNTTVTTNVGSHTVNIYNDETKQMETAICYITAKTEYQVWKCACGATQNRNGVTRTSHSICAL